MKKHLKHIAYNVIPGWPLNYTVAHCKQIKAILLFLNKGEWVQSSNICKDNNWIFKGYDS